jgi:exonuclease III
MIGLIWNCQGLGRSSKFDFLRELIRDEKVDFIGLQETKKNHFKDSLLSSLAGNKLFASFSSPPNGRSGGLLVGFNSEVFDVREHEAGEFMIRTLVLHREKNLIWNFVKVYGAAQKDHKSRFLSELFAVCSRSQVPLLIGGDFNIIRKAEEKNKPGGVNKWSSLFNSIIDQYGLVEFDLKNRLYTWSNNRSDPTFEKLDRFLASPDWDLAYNNISVVGLNISFSDHAPLCLRTDAIPTASKDFKYELCWRLRPDFHKLVKDNWSLPVRARRKRARHSIDVWKLKIKRLRQMLKGWNINVEGHYKKLKKNLISKIDILDKASEVSGLSETDRLEKLDLEMNLRKIVDEENIRLKQKARDKFMLNGDENSKYFHLLAKHKKGNSRS